MPCPFFLKPLHILMTGKLSGEEICNVGAPMSSLAFIAERTVELLSNLDVTEGLALIHAICHVPKPDAAKQSL
jgi:hypothetical protein